MTLCREDPEKCEPTAVSLGWFSGVRTCEMCGRGVRLTNAVVIGHDQGVVLFAHKKRCS